ncbi:MAG TPA: hypothetical protein VF692_02220 [Pyrinomonadaceae bacterium]|jgi:hypothetical protein
MLTAFSFQLLARISSNNFKQPALLAAIVAPQSLQRQTSVFSFSKALIIAAKTPVSMRLSYIERDGITVDLMRS